MEGKPSSFLIREESHSKIILALALSMALFTLLIIQMVRCSIRPSPHKFAVLWALEDNTKTESSSTLCCSTWNSQHDMQPDHCFL